MPDWMLAAALALMALNAGASAGVYLKLGTLCQALRDLTRRIELLEKADDKPIDLRRGAVPRIPRGGVPAL
jgi:hypothetical protein